MSNVSTDLYLKASKPKADGTCPVYVRVTSDRKSRLVSTGVYVEPKHWNKRRREVRASHDLADALNARLRSALNEAREAALGAPSAAAVKAALGGPSGTLSSYFARYLDRLRAKGARGHWEVKKFQTTRAKLHAALGDEVSWAELDRDALATFERHLRDVSKNKPNTVRKELSRLRRVVKEAVRDGEIAVGDDPFLVYRMPRGERVERRKLTVAEVRKIAALGPADGVADGSADAVARDAFAFSVYAAGMRFGDVARVKAGDVQGGRLTYKMLKTGSTVSLPLPPPALEIVTRYAGGAEGRGGRLFPILRRGVDEADGVALRKAINSANVVVNKRLKRLAKLAEIAPDGLSFHVARHTFADHARVKSGDLFAISKALGHSSLSVTEGYLKSFDRDAVDALSETIWL